VARRKPRRARGTGSYFRDGTGYRVVLSLGVVDGKRRQVRRRVATEAEAERELERMRRAYRAGVEVARETVGEYLAAWLDSRRADVRPRTIVTYEGNIRNHIVPLLGGIELSRLAPQDVRRLKADRLAAGLSPTSVGRVLTVLRAALAQAVRERIIADNPATAVQLPRVERAPIEPLTEERAAAVIEAVRGSFVENLVVLLLGSGMRVGEALGLDWRDVQDGYVIVRKTKTVVRAVPISADAEAAIASQRATTPRLGPMEPVFIQQNRSRKTRRRERMTAGSAWHTFQRLLDEAGLPRMRLHDLRHGVATLLVARGVHMRVVAEQLGHANPAMTARTYAHVVPQQQQDAVALLNRARGA
jgi:integrase